MATYLLAETNARPCVERQEDERVGNEIFLDALVDESVRVKRERYAGEVASDECGGGESGRGRRTVGAPEVLPAVHEQDRVEAPDAGRNIPVGLPRRQVLPGHALDGASALSLGQPCHSERSQRAYRELSGLSSSESATDSIVG